MSDGQQPERGMVHIGSVLGYVSPNMPSMPPPKPAKKTKVRSKKNNQPNAKLIEAVAEIESKPDKEKRAHISREFVQCSMPHRDPGKTEAWVRRNGNFTLMIEPGFDPKTKRSLGVPFGENAKLLAIWLETEAIKQGKCIKFGRSFNDFLRACGCNPDTGGGKRSAAKSMKNQMQRFFNARFSFEFSEVYAEQKLETRFNMNVARKVQYWWDLKSPDQGSFFDSEIVLDEEFYKAITANPISIDLREVIALKNSL
ncbi:MAG: hypothetical protein JOZ57_15155, partial [Abitibacteriaceae bacterium]|nr:hypothetical protein [Abditibacteriaceae bacterium]